MEEIISKVKNEIESFLQNSEEHRDKQIDCILVKPDTNETITIATDGVEETIMFAPYTTKEKGYDEGYMNVPDWDFNFDYYIFDELEKGYKVGFVSDNMNYGIWNTIEDLYPEDVDNKNGVQVYLKYCIDNNITKEYLDSKLNLETPDIMKFYDELEVRDTVEYKGYIAEIDEPNFDNEEENLIHIYKNNQDYIDGEQIETISLSKYGLKQNIQDYIDKTYCQPEIDLPREKAYLSFVLGYDLLNDMIKKYDTLECDTNYDFCSKVAEQFLNSDEYKDNKHSAYDMLRQWIVNNKEQIESSYKEHIGLEEKEYFIHPENSIFAGMQVLNNPDKAFDNAIKRGMKNPEDWMYMYSEKGRDYFKHCDTRQYTSYPQFGLIERIKKSRDRER